MSQCCISSEPVIIHKVVWFLWLEGYSVDSALQYLLKREVLSTYTSKVGVRNFVVGQYVNFELLSPLLQKRKPLQEQTYFRLFKELGDFLICTYYDLDAKVTRYLLGKKLSSKTKKGLSVAYRKIEVPLDKCKRIFDNLKRLGKFFETSNEDMCLFLQKQYYLPKDMSKQYVAVIFMCHHKMDIAAKKLSYLTLSDLLNISEIIMKTIPTLMSPDAENYDVSLSSACRFLKKRPFFNSPGYSNLENSILSFINSKEENHPLSSNVGNIRIMLQNILTLGTLIFNKKFTRLYIIKFHEKVFEPSFVRCLSSKDHLLVMDSIIHVLNLYNSKENGCENFDTVLSYVNGIKSMAQICFVALARSNSVRNNDL